MRHLLLSSVPSIYRFTTIIKETNPFNLSWLNTRDISLYSPALNLYTKHEEIKKGFKNKDNAKIKYLQQVMRFNTIMKENSLQVTVLSNTETFTVM